MSELEKEQTGFPAAGAKADQKAEKKESRFSAWLDSLRPDWWVKQPKPEKVKKPFKQELAEWGLTLLAALLIAFLARTFIFEPVRVDGDSMYPTLRHGEFMYVSKLDYGTSFIGIPFTSAGVYVPMGGNPDLFDVVVCNYPGRLDDNGARLNFVKRVVGLPGDKVEIRSGKLYVNGQLQEEKFLHQEMYTDMTALVVPAKGDRIEVRDNTVYLNGVAQDQAESYLSVILHQLMDGGSSYQLPETGDVFEILDHYLYVNGLARANWASLLLEAWNGQTFTVEQDHFFLMGDNRNNSNDSRNQIVGPVPRDMIVGKVEGVLWHVVPSTLEDWGLKD